MGIRLEQPGLAGLYGAAATISKGEAEARRKQEIQEQRQYQQSMKMLDAQLDLEMYERSKRWEIDKMQLRSQIDFQREEQQRQRKLDSIDSAIQQIDKEVLAGRITEQEAYPIKQKLEISKTGVSVPVSAFPGDEEDRFGIPPWYTSPEWKDTPEGIAAREKAFLGYEEDRYGVRPYYLEPEFERDYPEVAEAKRKEVISGQRRGVVPYYLDPTFIGNYPEAARQAQEARGIFLSDEEFEALTERPTMPLGDKQLDVGIRTETQVKTLDAATARQILMEAGGDREKARRIARQRGFSF